MSSLSYDDILNGVKHWGTDPKTPPYDFNGVLNLLAAAVDNLRAHSLPAEIEQISDSLTSDQMKFLCLLANRCGYSEFLQHCAHDAINIFIRDTLIPAGIVDADAYHANERIKGMQHKTCREAAQMWQDATISHDT